jgi:NADH-quinone oxidoreductase subunit N
MYTKETNDEKQAVPFLYYFVAVVAILLNIALGLYPSFVTNLLP